MSSVKKFAVLLILANGCTLIGCMCSDDVLSRNTSPDGTLVATLFRRDCGATTDYSTIVSVSGLSENFKDEKIRVFVAKGQHGITIKWTARRALSVECDSCSR